MSANFLDNILGKYSSTNVAMIWRMCLYEDRWIGYDPLSWACNLSPVALYIEDIRYLGNSRLGETQDPMLCEHIHTILSYNMNSMEE